MPVNAKLVVIGGDVKTEEIKLKLPASIGRGRGATIILAHPLVSRKHCELFENGGQIMVRDLGSLNGTFVNNQRVTEAPLKPGELLTIGTVTFRAVYEAESDDHAPAVSGPQVKVRNLAEAAARSQSPPAPAAKAQADSDAPLEFDFGRPLLPGEEEPAAARDATQAARRSQATVADFETQPLDPAKAKSPAPGSKPPSSAPGEAATIDFNQLGKEGEEEEEAVEAASDDDLDDFLKNLK
jgi:hypothetical protein